MRTARDAVAAADPAAKIDIRCVDTYPLKVTVSVVIDGKPKQLFEAPQRNLFRKNAAMRTQSINDIKTAVAQCI